VTYDNGRVTVRLQENVTRRLTILAPDLVMIMRLLLCTNFILLIKSKSEQQQIKQTNKTNDINYNEH